MECSNLIFFFFSFEFFLLLLSGFYICTQAPISTNSSFQTPSSMNFFIPVRFHNSSIAAHKLIELRSLIEKRRLQNNLFIFEAFDTFLLFSSESKSISNWIRTNFSCKPNSLINVHDFITGPIASLISSFYISNNHFYLNKAIECGKSLFPAFQNFIPYPFLNPYSQTLGKHPLFDGTTLTESSRFLIEFATLGKLSSDSSFNEIIIKYLSYLNQIFNNDEEFHQIFKLPSQNSEKISIFSYFKFNWLFLKYSSFAFYFTINTFSIFY